MTKLDQQSSENSTRDLLYYLVVTLLGVFPVAQQLWEARTVSWLLFGAGIFINIFIEAVSNTRPIQHTNEWSRRIGGAGRLLVALLLFAVLVWITVWLDNRGLLFLLWSFGLGMLLGFVVKVTMDLTRRRFSN